ncbi:16S rRNA (guanine(527)-N(7))-methyltransferase RsmG [Mycoplasmopsis citelli]|uniref:16S rRNA (guanine(527)-N(7))-methyltransferase RsmG n=1 Tax=Mycoplasmopsis citelli TaxID=171281 RepID=UPI002114E2B0|nr:16S rRNA (guanine(527)-N(7))-methyltransferase RsmG [Mycoplasmopsis citelli]UUD36085.1 16S rRNA (guanine(527)-N(7))-methyltransferase RsmG [Mycoplasmopsis citelli]
MLNRQLTEQLCKQNNWDFEKLSDYVELIEQQNQVMNLTGFSGDKLWEEGIYESLIFMNSIVNQQDNEILDIGSGVGFPSLPYAIVNQNKKFTIYEPLQKRVNFLNLVIEKLNLQNVEVLKIRAEEVLHKNLFDIVTARAVGNVATMLMCGFHLVKLNGKMSLIKGQKYQEELLHASGILKQLTTEVNIFQLKQISSDKQNNVVEITKKRSTPKQFPYKWKDIARLSKS